MTDEELIRSIGGRAPRKDLTRCYACKRPFTQEEQERRKTEKLERIRAAKARSRLEREEERKKQKPTEDRLIYLKTEKNLTTMQAAKKMGIRPNLAVNLWRRILRERRK